jgi:hypothetical protein
MSGALGAMNALGGMDGMAALVARLATLDAQLRTVDPTWQGLGSGLPVGVSTSLEATSASGGDFADVLSSVTPSADAMASASSASLAVSASGLAGSIAPLDSRFVEPVTGARVSQGFGPTTFALEPSAVVDGVRYAHFHDGLDLAAPLGTPVRAAAAGVVAAAGRQSDGAVVVRIRHADGSQTSYGHLQPDTAVQEGDRVRAGEAIGAIGLTGNTTGPHLHFELTLDGQALDPAAWIESGRLPGAGAGVAVAGDPGASAPGDVTPTDLAAFDAVADEIPYASQIRGAAVAAGVEPLLLASLVRAESGFRADAVSPAGALGLGQLMPANVRSLGVADPFDPAQNLRAAARYFANNLHLYGRTDVALAAYQAGKGSVARAGGIPASPTTHRYIDRILGFWSGYLDDAGTAAEAVG